MSEPNWEMLARVRDRIAEVGSEHCDMSSWSDGDAAPASGEVPCGATACIAGWALAIANGQFDATASEWRSRVGSVDERVISRAAAGVLGLTSEMPDLFAACYWPDGYQQTARDEGQAKGMLAILDDILDRRIDPNTLQAI